MLFRSLSHSNDQVSYEDRAKLDLNADELAEEQMMLALPEGVVIEMGSHF